MLIGDFAKWGIDKGLDIPEQLRERASRINPEHEQAAIAKEKQGPVSEARHEPDSILKDEPPSEVKRIKKSALIKKYKHEWPSAEADINEASRNDLSKAKLGGGYYDEIKAIDWAKERGKFEDNNLGGSAKPSIFNSPTSTINRLK
jgi:hypothetical protein